MESPIKFKAALLSECNNFLKFDWLLVYCTYGLFGENFLNDQSNLRKPISEHDYLNANKPTVSLMFSFRLPITVFECLLNVCNLCIAWLQNGANRAPCIAMLFSNLNLTVSSWVGTCSVTKMGPLTLSHEDWFFLSWTTSF